MTLCGTSHLFILIGFSLEHIFGPLNVKQNIGETANSILEQKQIMFYNSGCLEISYPTPSEGRIPGVCSFFLFFLRQIHNLTTSNEDKICNLMIQNKGEKRFYHLHMSKDKGLFIFWQQSQRPWLRKLKFLLHCIVQILTSKPKFKWSQANGPSAMKFMQ